MKYSILYGEDDISSATRSPIGRNILSVELEQKKRNLRKDNEMLVTRGETNTFQTTMSYIQRITEIYTLCELL